MRVINIYQRNLQNGQNCSSETSNFLITVFTTTRKNLWRRIIKLNYFYIFLLFNFFIFGIDASDFPPTRSYENEVNTDNNTNVFCITKKEGCHSTGLSLLDNKVMISPGEILAIVGTGSSGKSQYIFSTMAEALNSNEKSVIYYIDSTFGFHRCRLKEILCNRFGLTSGEKVKSQLNRIIVPNAVHDAQTLLQWFQILKTIVKGPKVIMLVIENIYLLLSSIFPTLSYYKEKGKSQQIAIFSQCKKLCKDMNFSVVVSSHLQAQNGNQLSPAIGKLYFNRMLEKTILLVNNGAQFHAQLFELIDEETYNPLSDIIPWYISQDGVTCNKKHAARYPSCWQKYGSIVPKKIAEKVEQYNLRLGEENDEYAMMHGDEEGDGGTFCNFITDSVLPNITNTVRITGQKRPKTFDNPNFEFANVARYFDEKKVHKLRHDMDCSISAVIIIEILHNVLLNVWSDVALTAPPFFELLEVADAKNSKELLHHLINYRPSTTRIIFLLPKTFRHVVIILDMFTKEMSYFDIYEQTTIFEGLQEIKTKFERLFGIPSITLLKGDIPQWIRQVAGDEDHDLLFGLTVMELLIKYKSLPIVQGFSVQRAYCRYAAFILEVAKFNVDVPEWSDFGGASINFFEKINVMHDNGAVDPSIVARFIEYETTLHSKPHIALFNPEWHKFIDDYPVELIILKFGMGVSDEINTVYFPIVYNGQQMLYIYSNNVLRRWNSNPTNPKTREWDDFDTIISQYMSEIVYRVTGAVVQDIGGATIPKNLLQDGASTSPLAYYVIHYARISILNFTAAKTKFEAAKILEDLKNGFPNNILDTALLKKAVSSPIGIKKYLPLLGCTVYEVEKDGNSFYRVASIAHYGDEEGHVNLRASTMQHIKDNANEFREMVQNVAQYVAHHSILNMQVEDAEMVALSQFLNTPLIILETGTNVVYLNTTFPNWPILMIKEASAMDITAYFSAVKVNRFRSVNELYNNDDDEDEHAMFQINEGSSQPPRKKSRTVSPVEGESAQAKLNRIQKITGNQITNQCLICETRFRANVDEKEKVAHFINCKKSKIIQLTQEIASSASIPPPPQRPPPPPPQQASQPSIFAPQRTAPTQNAYPFEEGISLLSTELAAHRKSYPNDYYGPTDALSGNHFSTINQLRFQRRKVEGVAYLDPNCFHQNVTRHEIDMSSGLSWAAGNTIKMYFPVLENNENWTLYVYYKKNKLIEYYNCMVDSVHGQPQPPQNDLNRLKLHISNLFGENRPTLLVINIPPHLEQFNSKDTGQLILDLIEYLIENRRLDNWPANYNIEERRTRTRNFLNAAFHFGQVGPEINDFFAMPRTVQKPPNFMSRVEYLATERGRNAQKQSTPSTSWSRPPAPPAAPRRPSKPIPTTTGAAGIYANFTETPTTSRPIGTRANPITLDDDEPQYVAPTTQNRSTSVAPPQSTIQSGTPSATPKSRAPRLPKPKSMPLLRACLDEDGDIEQRYQGEYVITAENHLDRQNIIDALTLMIKAKGEEDGFGFFDPTWHANMCGDNKLEMKEILNAYSVNIWEGTQCIFFPITVDDHWILFVYRRNTNMLTHYDAIFGHYDDETWKRYCNEIEMQIDDIINAIFNTNIGGVVHGRVFGDLIQKDAYNCGIHLLKFMELELNNEQHIFEEAAISFNPNTMREELMEKFQQLKNEYDSKKRSTSNAVQNKINALHITPPIRVPDATTLISRQSPTNSDQLYEDEEEEEYEETECALHDLPIDSTCEICGIILCADCLQLHNEHEDCGDSDDGDDSDGPPGSGEEDDDALRDHMPIHTGIKKYKCDVCSKSFARSDTLKEHMDIHSGIKKYKCDICETPFTQSRSLRKHMTRTHAKDKS